MEVILWVLNFRLGEQVWTNSDVVFLFKFHHDKLLIGTVYKIMQKVFHFISGNFSLSWKT